jgi:hypothetical protein
MEEVKSNELAALQETRDKAFAHLFALNENKSAHPYDENRWSAPPDAEDRLKSYVKAEATFLEQKVKAARPFFTVAEAKEMTFRNAGNFLEAKKSGQESMEKVLSGLFRFQRDREVAFEASKESKENQSERQNIFACQDMISRMTLSLLGSQAQERIRKA